VLNKIFPKKKDEIRINLDKKVILNDEEIIESIIDTQYVYTMGNCIIHRADKKTKLNRFMYVLLPVSEEYITNLKADMEDLNTTVTKINKADKLKEFEKRNQIPFANLVMYGDTENINTSLLTFLIPSHSYITKNTDTQWTKKVTMISYKCYTQDTKEVNYKNRMFTAKGGGLVIHEHILSSWKCVLEKIGNPKYAIILKEYY